MWVRFDLAPQRGDATINTTIVDNDVVSPHRVENLIASEGASRPLRKELEKLEFLAGKSDFRSVPKEFMRAEIEFAPAKLEEGRGRRTTAQQSSSASEQFANAEGFRQVVIRAKLKSANDIFFLTFGGQHDDGHLQLFRANGAADFVTVHFGKHDVQDQQVGRRG